jgi:hypothetical protein
VRLDHLLSKEHLARALRGCVSRAMSRRVPGMAAHLWGTGYSSCRVCWRGLVRLPLRGGWNGAAGGPGGAGTLLGPEGTGVSSSRAGFPAWRRGAGTRPYLENCTVDASIYLSVVAKLLRAHGGCLGTRSR